MQAPRLTLAIGVLLVSIAIVLAAEMKRLLIGEAASPDMVTPWLCPPFSAR